MAKSKRILAVILAALMLSGSLAACSSSDDDKKNDPSTTTSQKDTTGGDDDVTSETDRTEIKDSLPDDLDFEGRTFRFYIGRSSNVDDYVMGVDDDNVVTVLNEAVLERNDIVQNRLNFVMDAVPSGLGYDQARDTIIQLAQAGDSTYDVYNAHMSGMVQLVVQNVFYNAYDLDYLDFDQPWWASDFMSELQLGDDYRYFILGDFDIETISFTRALFFNTDLYTDLYGDPNDLYNEVLEGNWTLDHMNTLVAGAYADLNGDGITDVEDRLGFIGVGGYASTFDGLYYGTDVKPYTRDAEGFVTLEPINDYIVSVVEELNKFFYQDAVCLTDSDRTDVFIAGNVLFLGNARLVDAANLRNMEDNYGYLPTPKFTEDQESYHSATHDTVALTAVSNCTQNADMAGAVMEALNAESYRRTTPAYYESGLKMKYSRDAQSSKVVDIIKDARTANFVFGYNWTLNSIGINHRFLIGDNSNDLSSLVAEKLPAAQAKLDELTEFFKGNQ